MSRSQQPELKKFMDKRLQIQMNGKRNIEGTLRGYDPFLNIVLEDSVEIRDEERIDMGMVMVRGNSIVVMQPLEKPR